MSGGKVIELEGVSFAYDGVPVLERADLAVEAGELICMIGPNGGGKTTLLKLILGLLKPDAGKVRVFGGDPVQARHRIGYTPQYAHHDPQFPATVMDVVLMGRLERHWAGPYSREDRQAAMEALEELGIADLSERLFKNLSGGQRQRLLVARALASQPDLLLLDEPTANVDVVAEERVYEILERLNERMTIIMVSHDLGLVSRIVDRVVCVSGCLRVHPTSEIDAELIRDMYGSDFCVVRHDHTLPGAGGADG